MRQQTRVIGARCRLTVLRTTRVDPVGYIDKQANGCGNRCRARFLPGAVRQQPRRQKQRQYRDDGAARVRESLPVVHHSSGETREVKGKLRRT